MILNVVRVVELYNNLFPRSIRHNNTCLGHWYKTTYINGCAVMMFETDFWAFHFNVAGETDIH